MLYATRNTEGNIIGISDVPSDSAEPIANNHVDVKAYFSRHYNDFTPDDFLEDSDSGTTRILDDLVDLLVKKHIIMFTELPSEAQQKLISRRVVRSLINGNNNQTETPINNEHPLFLADDENLL
ncbi:hypothetical protein WN093_15170 [Gammaproteobacteria bacterium AS21]|jgi:hypothetical protein